MTGHPPAGRVYLIAPAPDYDGTVAVETYRAGLTRPFAVTAAAGIATIAAYFPKDTAIRLCDEIVQAVDFDTPVDLVGISMNVAQASRGIEIARRFREKGVPVVIGGAHVSLAPSLFEGVADTMVIGEFEPVAEAFMQDYAAGRLLPVYRGGQADMATTPEPRWDLYPNDRALGAVVQTSRGCPFDCHFCDVIQYLGRKQRHKPDAAVISECAALYELGYREISLSDDNFTVYRQRTRALLDKIASWNEGRAADPVRFSTQMSIDVARTPDILEACNRANLRYAFIGIETDNEEALAEARKRQNMRTDLVAACETVVKAGLTIRGGLIVGFDHDDLGCFERVLNFAQSLPVVGFNVGVLTAPVATPLFDMMKAQGRLIGEDLKAQTMGSGDYSNFTPKNMTRDQLAEGRNWLKGEIYAPDNTIARLTRYAELLADPVLPMARQGGNHAKGHPLFELVARLSSDPGARRVIEAARDLAAARPLIAYDLMGVLTLYLQEYALDRNVTAARSKRAS